MSETHTHIQRAVDRCIHGFAVSLVEKHGAKAPAEASRKARRLAAAGDRQASTVWTWIHLASLSVLSGNRPDRSVH